MAGNCVWLDAVTSQELVLLCVCSLSLSTQNGQPDHSTTILFDTSKKELHSPSAGFKTLQVGRDSSQFYLRF